MLRVSTPHDNFVVSIYRKKAMHKTLLALAFSTALVSAPGAFAQSVDPACMMKNADGTESVDMTKCPDGKTVGTGGSAQAPADGTTAPAPGTADTTASTNAMTPATGITIAPEAFANAKVMSANDFIGKRVYSTTNEDIGEVNDLIFSENGGVQAVVLGVGGFLGIGEKDVAVNISSLKMTPDGSSTRITVEATKDILNAAPQYDRTKRTYVQ
jgi:sporulation protein YlmC with PRC-barrel domain